MKNTIRNTIHKRGSAQNIFRTAFRQEKNASQESAATLEERIQRKAHELWEERGRTDGHDLDDWLKAERLVKSGRA